MSQSESDTFLTRYGGCIGFESLILKQRRAYHRGFKFPQMENAPMATIVRDTHSNQYHIRFRFAGRSSKRSLRTDRETQAAASLARLTETISLVRRGVLELPPEADTVTFLVEGREPSWHQGRPSHSANSSRSTNPRCLSKRKNDRRSRPKRHTSKFSERRCLSLNRLI